jgi:hypothetical protein
MRVLAQRLSRRALAAMMMVNLVVAPAYAQQAPPQQAPAQRAPAQQEAVQEKPKGPELDVANPSPGDFLQPGRMVIQGVAFDDNAEEGVGVDRVSIFVGDRDIDNGAIFLGDARLGLHNPQAVEGGDPQFDLAGWSLLTPPLKASGQERNIHVYARSSVSGLETVVVIPVIMGEEPPKGGDGAGGGEEGGPED